MGGLANESNDDTFFVVVVEADIIDDGDLLVFKAL